MCIAIYKPADAVLDRDTLFTCHKSNKDGCGFAFINADGELEIQKSMEFEAFYAMYQEALAESPDSPFLIHFRIATHGTVNEFNCHPFRIDDNHVFIHNGIISDAPDCPDKRRSDTQMFNEVVLQQLPKGWFYNAAIKGLINKFIDHSKLVVMNRKGEVSIFNEKKGHWKDGIWFSNYSYVSYSGKWKGTSNTTSGGGGSTDLYTHNYKHHDDGSWTISGNHRKYIDGLLHQFDDATKGWRPFSLVDGKYTDNLLPMRPTDTKKQSSYDCTWCGKEWIDSCIDVVRIGQDFSLMCKCCQRDLKIDGLVISVAYTKDAMQKMAQIVN